MLVLKETCSLAKAGEFLHLSSSAVFCKIRQLEDEIGQKLYERVGKRLELTEIGRLLVEQAESILRVHDDALALLRERGGQARSLLRLGSGPHGSLRVVPDLLKAFLAAHPNTDIRFESSDDQALLRDLRVGLLDAVLMSLPVNDRELAEEPLWFYEMVFVGPPAKTSGGKSFTLNNMRNSPFVLYRRTIVVESAVRQLCRSLDFKPHVVMENDQPDSIKAIVKLGLAVSILPYWSVADDSRKRTLRVIRAPAKQLHAYGVLFRKSAYRPRILDHFLQVARQWQQWWLLAEYVHPPG